MRLTTEPDLSADLRRVRVAAEHDEPPGKLGIGISFPCVTGASLRLQAIRFDARRDAAQAKPPMNTIGGGSGRHPFGGIGRRQ